MAFKVSDVIGEGRLRQLRTEGKSNEDILSEVNAELDPVKKALGDEVYTLFQKDEVSFAGMKRFAEHLTLQAVEDAKRKEEEDYAKQVEIARKAVVANDDGTTPFENAVANNFARIASATNSINPFTDDKPAPYLVGFQQAMGDLEGKYKKQRLSPDEFTIYEADQKRIQDSKGIVDGVSAVAQDLYHRVQNPSALNPAGIFGELVSGPENLVAGPVAGVATKAIANTALKAGTKAVGATSAGLVTGMGTDYGYEYAVQKGNGASDKEAHKAASLNAATGAAMNLGTATLGTVAGTLHNRRVVRDGVDKFHTPTSETVTDTNPITIPDEIEHSIIMQVDKAESHADDAAKITEQIEASVGDRAKVDELVTKYAPQKPDETALSVTLNGAPMKDRLSGGRLRNALQRSVDGSEISVDEMDVRLRDAGVNDELRHTVLTAYNQRDMSIYDAYVTNKLEGVIDGARNRAGNTAGEADGVSGGTTGAREGTTTDAGQKEVSTFEAGSTEGRADLGQDTRNGGELDGVPTLDGELEGQQSTGADGETVLRTREDAVVPTQDGVPTELTNTVSPANEAKFDKKTLTVTYDNGVTKQGGHRNWRNNNPGNIEYGEYAKAHGAIGSDGRFAIFSDMQDGYDAQASLLHSKNYKNLSLRDAIARYAPASENNVGAYVNAVTKDSGIGSEIVMRDLSPAQLDAVVRAMSKHEGMKAGKEYVVGKEVPPTRQQEDGAVAVVDNAEKINAEIVDAIDNKELPTLSKADEGGVSRVDTRDAVDTVDNTFMVRELPSREKAIETIKNSENGKRITQKVATIGDEAVLETLNFKKDVPVVRVLNNSDVKHIFKQHGSKVSEEKRGQVAITNRDIANYPEMVKSADAQTILTYKNGKRKMVSLRQSDGFYTVVEEISTKKNTLSLKTMYKRKGEIRPDTLDKIVADESHLLTSKNDTVAYTVENMPSPVKSITEDRVNVKTPKEAVETNALLAGHDVPLSTKAIADEIDSTLAALEPVDTKVQKSESIVDELLGDTKIDAKVEKEIDGIIDPIARENARAELEGRESIFKEEC